MTGSVSHSPIGSAISRCCRRAAIATWETQRFAEKRPVYSASQFTTTRRLAEEYDTWTVEKIRSRQTWMAKQATGVWRVDF